MPLRRASRPLIRRPSNGPDDGEGYMPIRRRDTHIAKEDHGSQKSREIAQEDVEGKKENPK